MSIFIAKFEFLSKLSGASLRFKLVLWTPSGSMGRPISSEGLIFIDSIDSSRFAKSPIFLAFGQKNQKFALALLRDSRY